ncbi:glycoside hydrolase family 13 protein [Mycena filopes]|nr:glycoside hydrolase family 13 protein [Mycena filopes]
MLPSFIAAFLIVILASPRPLRLRRALVKKLHLPARHRPPRGPERHGGAMRHAPARVLRRHLGITKHLDCIQQMGIDADWISPIVQNVEDAAGRPGGVSKALRARGMYLMLDVVVNHCVGVPTSPTLSPDNLFSFDYASLLPFGTQEDFLKQGFIGASNDQAVLEQCWLGDANLPLPDLDTEDPGVHIRRDFWNDFAESAGVFTMGEVLTTAPVYAASPEGKLSAIQASPSLPALAPPASARGFTASFLENHDQPRSSTTDMALMKNAEQGYGRGADPDNREALWLSGYTTNKPLLAHVKALNAPRKLVIAKNPDLLTSEAVWIPRPNPSALMLPKPPLLTLLTNIRANSSAVQSTWHIPAYLYKPNATLVDVLACNVIVVDGNDGKGVTAVKGEMPMVRVEPELLSRGGGACAGWWGRGVAGKGRVVTALAVLGTAVVVVALL